MSFWGLWEEIKRESDLGKAGLREGLWIERTQASCVLREKRPG